MYVYYPSCNFQKQFPETAAKIRSYLLTQPDVRIAGCCHVTQQLPQAGDTIVTICMSCMRRLAEIRADVPQISFAEFMLTRRDFVWPDLHGEEVTLQDCFRARGMHGLQDAVRSCLRRMDASVVEMEHNRDEETFDGSFLFHDPVPVNVREAPKYFRDTLPPYITPLPKEEWPEAFQQHAKLYRTDRVVCYCNVCTQAAQEGGADAWHLAEIMFGR